MRRSVFGLGTAQVLTTGTAITLLALALGLSTRSALVVGFGLALSSTAFAVLLFQDLAIVPLIALVPLLARPELSITQVVELAGLESVLIIVGGLRSGSHPAAARTAIRRQKPTESSRYSPPPAYCWCSVPAWLTEWAGLSMALGAFLGGLLLADSRYRHQIIADIQPFRGLLLGLFFMSVGMSVNFALLGQQGVLMAGLVGGLLLLKAAILWALCRITGCSHTESIQVALLLAQAGEFGFILFGLAHMLGLTDGELYQLLLLVIALSMVATPLLVRLGRWLGPALASYFPGCRPPERADPRLTQPCHRRRLRPVREYSGSQSWPRRAFPIWCWRSIRRGSPGRGL